MEKTLVEFEYPMPTFKSINELRLFLDDIDKKVLSDIDSSGFDILEPYSVFFYDGTIEVGFYRKMTEIEVERKLKQDQKVREISRNIRYEKYLELKAEFANG